MYRLLPSPPPSPLVAAPLSPQRAFAPLVAPPLSPQRGHHLVAAPLSPQRAFASLVASPLSPQHGQGSQPFPPLSPLPNNGSVPALALLGGVPASPVPPAPQSPLPGSPYTVHNFLGQPIVENWLGAPAHPPPPMMAPAALPNNGGAAGPHAALALLNHAHNVVQAAMHAIEAAQAAIVEAPAPQAVFPQQAPGAGLMLANAPPNAPPIPVAPIAVAPIAVAALPPARRERKRSLEENLELATWLVDDGAGVMGEVHPQKVFLRSLTSVASSAIVFVNNTKASAQAVWLNYKGHEVAYSVIKPGEKKKYRTYATHPWIIRDEQSQERLLLGKRTVVYASGEEQTVEIRERPSLAWSFETHTAFPKSFKDQVKALLLSHQRLRRPDLAQLAEARAAMATLHVSENGATSQGQGLLKIFKRAFCSIVPKNVVSAPPSAAMELQPIHETQLSAVADLPLDLVHLIIKHAAPAIKQDLSYGVHGHPDILPALLPSDPATWPAMAAAAHGMDA